MSSFSSKDQEGLQNQRHSDQQDVQRAFQYDAALKGKQQDQREQQADGRDSVAPVVHNARLN